MSEFGNPKRSFVFVLCLGTSLRVVPPKFSPNRRAPGRRKVGMVHPCDFLPDADLSSTTGE